MRNARSYKQHFALRHDDDAGYPHAPRDYWNRRRQLWMQQCIACDAPYPCSAVVRDAAVADADLRAYWRQTAAAHAAAAVAGGLTTTPSIAA